MPTECTQTSFRFQGISKPAVEAQFNGGTIATDAGGLLLLRETNRDPRSVCTAVFRRPRRGTDRTQLPRVALAADLCHGPGLGGSERSRLVAGRCSAGHVG